MWFELVERRARPRFAGMRRAPGTSPLIVVTLALAIARGDDRIRVRRSRAVARPAGGRQRRRSCRSSRQRHAGRELSRARVSAPDFLDYRPRTTTLEQLAALRDGRARADPQRPVADADGQLRHGQPVRRDGAARRSRAACSRTATIAPGAAPVARAVASLLARRDGRAAPTRSAGRCRSAASIVTVVGVLSPDIEFGNIGEIDAVAAAAARSRRARAMRRNLRFLARLEATASRSIRRPPRWRRSATRWRTNIPRTNGGWRMRLVPIRELTGGDGFWVVIALFLLSIGLLMAIATANVSNLVHGRARLARARELAVRTRARRAQGADGWCASSSPKASCCRLAAALMSLPLALAGIQRDSGDVSAEAVFRQLTIDVHELAFVALARADLPAGVLARAGRACYRARICGRCWPPAACAARPRSTRGRGALVVVQVALAVILLTVSSLALRSDPRRSTRRRSVSIPRMLLVLGLEFNEVQYPENAQSRAAAAEHARSACGAAGRDDGGDGECAADSWRSHAGAARARHRDAATPTR